MASAAFWLRPGQLLCLAFGEFTGHRPGAHAREAQAASELSARAMIVLVTPGCTFIHARRAATKLDVRRAITRS